LLHLVLADLLSLLVQNGPLGLRPLLVVCPLLVPQRAQVRLTLRVRRRSLLSGCGRGAGEELRLPAWLPGSPAPPAFRCEHGTRGGSVRSRRTRAHDLDLWRVAVEQAQRQMDLN
jgi:hypothetical protein